MKSSKFLIKTVDKKIIEVEGIIVKENKNKISKAPAWFIHFEEKLDKRLTDLEIRLENKIDSKIDSINKRIDNLIIKNNLKE